MSDMSVLDLTLLQSSTLRLYIPQCLRSKPITVVGLTLNSKEVKPGFIFAALPGEKTHGLQYLSQAVQQGAIAILVLEKDYQSHQAQLQDLNLPILIGSGSIKSILASICNKLYPHRPESMVALTGTNGKTSSAWLIWSLWQIQQKRAASLGTLGLCLDSQALETGGIPSNLVPQGLTTLDLPNFHRAQNSLAIHGVDHLVFEASSHALVQGRLHNIAVDCAVFTNLTQDHLDYHHNMSDYFHAKERLFLHNLKSQGRALLCLSGTSHEDPWTWKLFHRLVQDRPDLHIELIYSSHYSAIEKDLRSTLDVNPDFPLENLLLHHLTAVKASSRGLELDVSWNQAIHHLPQNSQDSTRILTLEDSGSSSLTVPLYGLFQAWNLLIAILTTTTSEERLHQPTLQKSLMQLSPVSGRMESVLPLHQALIFIDYAHTPDALSKALLATRAHLSSEGRLHLVFGCGGDRDALKRPIMGAIANEQADVIYLTDDNPRTEDPANIRADIKQACPQALEFSSRKEAILHAMKNLKPHDALLIAGKGHETTQTYADHIAYFSDKEEVEKAWALQSPPSG